MTSTSPKEANEQRLYHRYATKLEVRVRELAAPAVSSHMTDISLLGCRLGSSVLPAGAEVWLQPQGHQPLRARVIWSDAGQAGLQFYAPVDPLRFRSGGSRGSSKLIFPPRVYARRS